ncbi:MAG: caspase family protein [Gemmataceae bacterium]|nr:caspase family protein [Gemmataceae bacterium]
MSQVVQARCPHCQNVLNIPADWLHQPMRCRFCQQVFQVRQRPPTPAPQAAPRTPRAGGKGYLDAPVAAPVAPPPPGMIPVRRVGAPASPLNVNGTAKGTPPPRPPSRRGWWKGLLLSIIVGGAATALAIFLGPEIAALFNPAPIRKDGPTELVQGGDKTDPPHTDDSKKSDSTPPPKADPPGPKQGPPRTDSSKPKVDPPKPDPPKPDPPKQEPPKVIPKQDPPKQNPPKQKPPEKITPGNEPFPRRALLISVNDYLFANPLVFGISPQKGIHGTSTWALRTYLMGIPLRIPGTQIVHLSDASPVEPHAPLKPVIERTVEEFLTTSRDQDRIVVLFSGHAVEDDKEAYLVPIEGDVDDPKTLIPLSWVYNRLKACKARQKILILDVCRFDPSRGQERPGGDPMGKILDARLQQPPDGVQVWSSCVLGQQSIQLEYGSVFLHALCGLQSPLDKLNIQEAGNSIPVEDMVRLANVEMDRALARYKLKQTSRLSGKETPGGAPPNPEAERPPVITIAPPPAPGGSAAPVAEVKAILDELNQIPPPRVSRSGVKDDRLDAARLPALSAKALEPYKADYLTEAERAKAAEKSPFRVAVLNAVKVLKENAQKFKMLEYFPGPTAKIKPQIKNEQAAPGKATLYLEEALEELRKVAKQRKDEPSKRWQAHYDYVLARLLSRLIYVTEYNYVLAQIRTDSLPELEAGMTGYRLGANKKISVTENFARDWAKELRALWDKIIADHPSTPWAIMAQRERPAVLGLEWRPARQ